MAALASVRGLSRALPRAAVAHSTGKTTRVSALNKVARQNARSLIVRAEPEKPTTPTTTSYSGVESSVDFDKLAKDLQEKWDAVDNKTSVIVYGSSAIVFLWIANTVVSAVDGIPLLPKLLELVGLIYTSWFVYRYLLFKSSREELVQDVEELKKKISGTE